MDSQAVGISYLGQGQRLFSYNRSPPLLNQSQLPNLSHQNNTRGRPDPDVMDSSRDFYYPRSRDAIIRQALEAGEESPILAQHRA